MSGDPLQDIRSLTLDELRRFTAGLGEKPYRAGQIWDWLWKQHVRSFDAMSNLPKELQAALHQHFIMRSAIPEFHQKSKDGTIKVVFRLHDGLVTEGVLIPSGERFTVCLSSQVGCALGCRFCATGAMGFRRNLSAGEIVDQLTGLRSYLPDPEHAISNIVFMGMGEPFLNYQNVRYAIDRISAHDGLGMSPQRITVSSVGLPKMIRQMADESPRYHFALSLHSANDQKRDQIIPFNLKSPLAELKDALKYYHQKTGKRFTIEYLLLGQFNDSVADAKELAAFCRSFPVKVNLIEYNPVDASGFRKSLPEQTRQFAAYLESRNLIVNIRQSKGNDIAAACGQLAAKELKISH